jgi:hypothetical protein
MKTIILVIAGTFCLAASGRPETVLFKNGDRVTGQWLRVNDGKLVFNAEALGEVTILLGKVQSFASERAAVVLLKNGQTVRGKLSLDASGDWQLKAEGTSRPVKANAVQAIYPAGIYEPRSPERSRKPWENWRGSGNFGYNLARGDRQAGTISIGVNATRRQPDLPGLGEHLRTHYFLTMLFAGTRSLDGVRSSANSVTSGLRQDFLFTPSNFVFVLGQLDHIQAQSLDLRQTYGAGLGHDLLRKRRSVFSFLGGTTYVRERFQGGVGRENTEGLLGERLGAQLSGRVRLDHLLNFYPNLSHAGRYRVDTTTTLSTKLFSRLSMTSTFTDRYLSFPLPGHKKNELLLTTGLGFSF